jgi:hypothetical protein
MNGIITLIFVLFIFAAGFVFINMFLNVRSRAINWKLHLVPLVIASVLCFTALLYSLLAAGSAVNTLTNNQTNKSSSRTSDNSLYK